VIRLTGGFSVAAPPERAFHYFTPHGEREWAPGWDPHFPSADETVFETHHSSTTWVVVDWDPGQRIRYARIARGLTAGTVDVRLAAQGDGATEVTVTYGLAALTDAGREHLERFAADYEGYLRSWEEAIAAVLT
jgi:hypothetical protein